MSKRFLGNAMLLIAALIWGCAFVAQSIGMDYVEPFTFTAARSLMGAAALLPCIWFFDRSNRKKGKAVQGFDKNVLTAGILSGVALSAAVNLQQIGLIYTTAGKAGFITALYIVFVPISGIFLHKRLSLNIWLSVVLATVGLYLLCMNESLSLNIGDILVFMSAFVFTAQILVVDKYASLVDGVRMACLQFFVCGVISGVFMFACEEPQIANILQAWAPICYTAFLSTSVGYTFQILGQKYTEPTVASLLMSLESVFAAICGAIVLHELMSGRELLGSLIMFAALIIAQLPGAWFSRKKA